MDIQNHFSIKQSVNLAGAAGAGDTASRAALAQVYDYYRETVSAFSAVVELLCANSAGTVDAGNLYFLLAQQEARFGDTLDELERLL